MLDAHSAPVVWLLPVALSRNPVWLEPLRRLLSRIRAPNLFPLLDRMGGSSGVPVHQDLMHVTLTQLGQPGCDIPSIFSDERWQEVRSTAPLHVWDSIMGRLGLQSSLTVTDRALRKTAPLLDLLALGHCPEVSAECMRQLCLGLAPYLDSKRDKIPLKSPLQWAPVRLVRNGVEFCFHDETAETIAAGRFTVTTQEGLTRITEGDHHVGTVTQGRFGMLRSGYDLADLCSVLPAWITEVEQAEASRGVPSAQFMQHLRTALDADCVVGCQPLVAPSSFPIAIRGWDTAEGWGLPLRAAPKRVLCNLLTLSAREQHDVCRPLTPQCMWFFLTRDTTLALDVKAQLERQARIVTCFKPGTRAAASKGFWRQGQCSSTKTLETWTLWASHGAVTRALSLDMIRQYLNNMCLTRDGGVPFDLDSPAAREWILGPAGAAYNFPAIVVGGDGSKRGDVGMGAAFVSKDGRIPARSAAVFGPPSSLRPELSALAMALEAAPLTEELTYLTDSLAAMDS